MEKIVNIRERIENRKNKNRLKQYQNKIDAIQKVTQCSSCNLKCAMCGKYLDVKDPFYDPDTSDCEYTFCESCGGEFEDFLSLSKGEENPQVFWHNKEWKKMWSAWLSYQQAIDDFMDTQEYKIMLEELDTQP
ncbi:hypothetical protein ACFLZG_07270 [Thermodesulfobacteriota bacterium]